MTSKPEKFIIGGLLTSGIGLFVFANSAVQWSACLAAWGTAEAMRSRRKLSYSEVVQGTLVYSQDVLGEVAEVVSPVTDAIERQRVQLLTSALKQMPMGDRIAEQFINRTGLKSDWFDSFESRPFVVCGESGDGKTFLLKYRVQRFIQAYPDGELLICDIDYGSSHKGSEPNTWFGLPVGKVVQVEPEDITATIKYVADELEARAKSSHQTEGDRPQKKPLLLVIDEWVSYYQSLSGKEQDEVIELIRKFNVRGLKQNVHVVLGLHSLAVGETGLDKALIRKFDVLMLRRAAQEPDNYMNIGATSDRVSAAIDRIRGLPKVIKGLRPCVVYADKELSVKALPHLEVNEAIELVATPEPIDPDQQWLDEIWTPETEGKILARMAERTVQGKAAIAYQEFAGLAGLAKKLRTNDSRRYQLLKNRIDDLHARNFSQSGNREQPADD
ncbi:hypothetical protein [Leptolyngbya sp. FACHB-711]|uniref:hypothetical protein n=1 Tax=Leptolyngbya sp. FACHB-711 TaxID=2692813 RepID=UPI0016887BAE|nr:hypothetical protein [Leptolyngbya sp. FACHB-711]MBD2025255.1 hypothetical protein [Leptolyngbya sp. FACHB-711]